MSPVLTESQLDLSFENLCQELLALSASCTTLEKMISHTESQIQNTDKQQNGSINCHTPAPLSPPHEILAVESQLSNTPPPVPQRTSASRSAVSRLSKSSDQQILQPPSDGSTDKASQSSGGGAGKQLLSGTVPSVMVLPTEKMKALTVDVGGEVCNTRAKVPPKNGLIRVTSPQILLERVNGQSTRTAGAGNSSEVCCALPQLQSWI